MRGLQVRRIIRFSAIFPVENTLSYGARSQRKPPTRVFIQQERKNYFEHSLCVLRVSTSRHGLLESIPTPIPRAPIFRLGSHRHRTDLIERCALWAAYVPLRQPTMQQYDVIEWGKADRLEAYSELKEGSISNKAMDILLDTSASQFGRTYFKN